MPQMAPIWWTMLFMTLNVMNFTVAYMVYMIIMYFFIMMWWKLDQKLSMNLLSYSVHISYFCYQYFYLY